LTLILDREIEMTFDEVMSELGLLESADNRAGMARFGINTNHALGVSVVNLRAIGKRIKRKDHLLANRLWSTGIHEARILASIVEEPAAVSEEQMEAWVRDFDSWDLCDQCCGNLFQKTPYAWD
jgi:3-methyladenine DNA glycosylase AlkD